MKAIVQAIKSLFHRLERLVKANTAGIEAIRASNEANSARIDQLCDQVFEGRNFKLAVEDASAEGDGAIAAGYGCVAEGDGTAAFGYGTRAGGSGQTAIGKYNKPDTEEKYAFIVGNGSSPQEGDRANIHTTEWNGNAWYAGSVECRDLILVTANGKRIRMAMQDNMAINMSEVKS